MSETPRWGGLINQGSTCYLNCLIQALFHTPLFRRKIFEIESNDNLVLSLQSIFCRLQSEEQNISTTELTTAFGWGGDHIAVQHDVHELIQLLFDRLEKVLKGTPMENFIRDIFGGELIYRSQAVDTSVKYVSDRLETFYDLEVIVKDSASLDESLEKLSTPEKIEGVTVEVEPGKPIKSNIERSLRLLNLPPVLMVHPNRVTFDTETYELQTINSLWQFKTSALDLSRFLIDSDKLKLDKESRAKPPTTCKVRNHSYSLHAILIHSGTTRLGHYYAYVRLHDQWVCFNDEHVSFTTENLVLRSAFGGQVARSNSLYENERASVLIYINDSLRDEILDERSIVVPERIFALKKVSVDFFACGQYTKNAAILDRTLRRTAHLRASFTLSELKTAISVAVEQRESTFKLHALYPFMHVEIKDIDQMHSPDARQMKLVVVPLFVECVVRILWQSPPCEYLATVNETMDVLEDQRLSGHKIFSYTNQGVMEIDQRHWSRFKDFFVVSSNQAMDIHNELQRYTSLQPSTSIHSLPVVHVPSWCNGMWRSEEQRLCVVSKYNGLQKQIFNLYVNDGRISERHIAFIRPNDVQIPFPLLMDPESQDRLQAETIYYTILPGPVSSYHHALCIILNIGWKNQPRIYLPRTDPVTVSVQRILQTALEQVPDRLPDQFKKRIQDNLAENAPFGTLLKTDGKVAEVVNDEVVVKAKNVGKYLYVLDCCVVPPGFIPTLVVFWSSQVETKFFGVPMFIAIHKDMDETGKTVLERVWKRLRIPEESSKTNPKLDIMRWMILIETSSDKIVKVGLKEKLRDVIRDKTLRRILVDRPAMSELDGTKAKDSDNLTMN